jgi:hypothetical protein
MAGRVNWCEHIPKMHPQSALVGDGNNNVLRYDAVVVAAAQFKKFSPSSHHHQY